MKRITTKKPFSTFYEDCESKRKSIARMRRRFPCYSLQQIGDKFGISRERVRQILNEMGEETKGLKRLMPPTVRRCQRCEEEIVPIKVTYCAKCRYELHNVQIVCDQCMFL